MAKFITLVDCSVFTPQIGIERHINTSMIKELASFSETITLIKLIDNDTLYVNQQLDEVRRLIEEVN